MNPIPQLRIMIPMPVEDLTPSYLRHYVRSSLQANVMDGFMYMYRDLLAEPDFYSYVVSREAVSNHTMNLVNTPFMNEYDIKVLFSRLYRGHIGHGLNALIKQFRERGFVTMIDEELNCWIYVG